MANDDIFKVQLQKHIEEGWEVVSEGPSGAQLKQPKKVRLVTYLCIAGTVIAFLAGQFLIGGVALVLAGLNHFLTKEKKMFLSK